MSYQFAAKDLVSKVILGSSVNSVNGIADPLQRVLTNFAFEAGTDKTKKIPLRSMLDTTEFAESSKSVTKSKALSADAEVSVGTGPAVSATLKASSEKDESKFVGEYNVVYGYLYENQILQDGIELSDDSVKLLQAGKIDTFLSRYGDSFVSSISYGIAFHATLKFENLTRKNKKDLESKLSAHGGSATALLGALSTSGELHDFMSREKITYKLSVNQRGGALLLSSEEELKSAQEKSITAEAKKKAGAQDADAKKKAADAALKEYTAASKESAATQEVLKTKADTLKKSSDEATAAAALASQDSDVAKSELELVQKKILETTQQSVSQTDYNSKSEIQKWWVSTQNFLAAIKADPKKYEMIALDCGLSSYTDLASLIGKSENYDTIVANLNTVPVRVLDINKIVAKIDRCLHALDIYTRFLAGDTSFESHGSIRAKIKSEIDHHTRQLQINRQRLTMIKFLNEAEYKDLLSSINLSFEFERTLQFNKETLSALKHQPAAITIASSELRGEKAERQRLIPGLRGYFNRHWYSLNYAVRIPQKIKEFVVKVQTLGNKPFQGNLAISYEDREGYKLLTPFIDNTVLLGEDRKKQEEESINSIKKKMEDYKTALEKLTSERAAKTAELSKAERMDKGLSEQSEQTEKEHKAKKEDESNPELIKKLRVDLSQLDEIFAKQAAEYDDEGGRLTGLEITEAGTIRIPVSSQFKAQASSLADRTMLFKFAHEKGERVAEVNPFTVLFSVEEELPTALCSPVAADKVRSFSFEKSPTEKPVVRPDI